ncbi:MAG: hypothetical protein IKV22_01510 [Paludibacteraceae bacterium]|nr:hypothetical protein [Paludibacteraceae bacterium]
MKRVFLFILALGSLLLVPYSALADETVTVTATTSDISENLDLKTVATLFGQAKDLEQFEQLLNNPDSAFSNLDLNGDGEVDYLRVIETADNNRHLVVIQAVLAKDIYQDVASIFVEKDADDQITVQVVGDEYIYGADYIIEPVYIYRPLIYDWFWGTSWVCWHSPYYWGYWPGWWRPYYCVDPFLYWDHCYWHHYHYPYCSFRMGHHHHAHYHNMYDRVRRNDYAHRHPERSFATRNASRNVSNARAFEQSRRTAVRDANATRTTTSRGSATRVSTSSTTRGNAAQASRNATYGSTNVRGTTTATRGNATRTSTTTTSRTSTATTRTTTTTRTTATPSRTTTTRSTITTTRTQPSRSSVSTATTPSRSSSSAVRSSSSSTMRSSAPSSVRSSSSSTMRSSGGMSGGGSRSGGSSSSRSGGSTRR